jgi:hypothetical protein
MVQVSPSPLLFYFLFIFCFQFAHLNSYLNSVIFAGVLYVHSILMLCGEYHIIILFEARISHWIVLHTNGGFKIAIRHDVM